MWAQEPTFRLYGQNNRIELKNSNGKSFSFPNGVRVTQSKEGFVIYNNKTDQYELFQSNGKKIRKETLPVENIESCISNSSMEENFFKEAYEAIGQIRKTNIDKCERLYESLKDKYPDSAKKYENCQLYFKSSSPQFYKLLSQTEQKLAVLKSNPNKSQILEAKLKRHNKNLFNKKNNVTRINDYKQLLLDVYDPKREGKSFSSTTQYIPISFDWISSNKKLKEWFDKEWTGKGLMSPFLGNSGEGISYSPDDPEFTKMTKKLLELRDYSHSLNLNNLIENKKVAACPGINDIQVPLYKSAEYKWLQSLDQNTFKNKERLIFIHNKTFHKKQSQWQDYIPTDQSMGCFKSDPVFSTLIHEANVNSGKYNFFPDDTHGAFGDESVAELLKLQTQNSHRFKSFVSREYYLQLIYLAMILID